MRTEQGFTLIELIIFIVITGLLASTILFTFRTALLSASSVDLNIGALQIAQKCMDWFMSQRHYQGYSFVTCPSTAVPAYCTTAGYTITVNVSCLTINTDTNYKGITVTVSGSGNATLTSLIANY